MSLTSFLRIPKVKAAFHDAFEFVPPKLSAEMKAPPQTQNFTLVGTAFDYLLRFHLERLNPNSITSTWIAEIAVEMTKTEPDLYLFLKERLESARKTHELFIKNGILTDGIVTSSIFLAKLDPLYRAGYFDPALLDVNQGDVLDLNNLISVVDFSIFKSNHVSILNPSFGEASNLVGGADADFIIDDILIDIKTTKNLKFDREYYNQLVGYYMLSKLGEIDGMNGRKIDKIGIYFSRHGLLHAVKVSNIENNPKFPSFVKWFEKEAKETFKESMVGHFKLASMCEPNGKFLLEMKKKLLEEVQEYGESKSVEELADILEVI